MSGSFYPIFDDAAGETHQLFVGWTTGDVSMRFDRYVNTEAYKSPEKRAALLNRLNAIEGIDLPPDSIDKWRGFPIGNLSDDQAVEQFLRVWDDYLADIRGD